MKTENNKHTQGEWKVGKCYEEDCFVIKAITGNPMPKTPAIVEFGADTLIGKEEAEANAQLICKAVNNYSALLGALKGLLSSYRADFKNITGAELNNTESVLKALAAIKQAEQ
jgi:hypothetical protein